LVDEEVLGRQHADVGRDHVARGEVDEVAGHEFAERNLTGRAVAHDGRRYPDHGLEPCRRGVRTEFLGEAQADAQDADHRHDDGGAHVAGGERDDGEDAEQGDERVGRGPEEADRPSLGSLARDLVGTMAGEAKFGLPLCEPAGRRPESAENVALFLAGRVRQFL
jgi:hypothetical protein